MALEALRILKDWSYFGISLILLSLALGFILRDFLFLSH